MCSIPTGPRAGLIFLAASLLVSYRWDDTGMVMDERLCLAATPLLARSSFVNCNWHELFNSLRTYRLPWIGWLRVVCQGYLPITEFWHTYYWSGTSTAFADAVQALGLHMARLLARIISLVT